MFYYYWIILKHHTRCSGLSTEQKLCDKTEATICMINFSDSYIGDYFQKKYFESTKLNVMVF